MVSPLSGRPDPSTLVGKRVELRIYLAWDLKFPKGTIVRVLRTNADKVIVGSEAVFYLVELDTEMSIQEPSRRAWFGLWKSRPAPITRTKYIIVDIATRESMERLLHEETASQMSYASFLIYPLTEGVLEKEVLDVRQDMKGLGPGGMRVLEESKPIADGLRE